MTQSRYDAADEPLRMTLASEQDVRTLPNSQGRHFLLFEHRVFTPSGQEIMSSFWCEKHWQDMGKALYEDDKGRKEVRKLYMDTEEQVKHDCNQCQEEAK